MLKKMPLVGMAETTITEPDSLSPSDGVWARQGLNNPIKRVANRACLQGIMVSIKTIVRQFP
jgi:hypothetical protein